MKKKTKELILKITFASLFILLFVILYIMSMACITYYHENVHQQIFARYGIDSTIEYDFLMMGGTTIPEKNSKCSDECNSFHVWNEIIGYNLIAFSHLLWFLLWAFFFWFSFLRDE